MHLSALRLGSWVRGAGTEFEGEERSVNDSDWRIGGMLGGGDLSFLWGIANGLL